MGLYQQILTALALIPPQPGAQEALPNPFLLQQPALMEGNPLAQYAELRQRERDYLKGLSFTQAFNGPLTADLNQVRMYSECRATVEGNLGRIADSLRSQAVGDYLPPVQAVHTDTPLKGLRRRKAVDFLLEGANRHRWLMLGEEHMKPQSRSFLIPLLRGLRKKGFRYFAAETFGKDIARASRRGYVEWSDGTYTQDPVFASAVREAIRLGYTLVPYDDTSSPSPSVTDFMARVNFRETAQAMRLKERILDRDPGAKVLVWGGRGHVSEEKGEFPDGKEFQPMAFEFRRLTGLDPLTAYLPLMMEAGLPAYEPPIYKDAVQRGWVNEPTVFLGKEPYSAGTSDVAVFFPRTRYVQGRPDWMQGLMDRVPVLIPRNLVGGQGMLLAQARPLGEPDTAVPVDQILLMPGDPVPALMLPRKGAFRIRVIDPAGAVVGRQDLRTP